MYASDDPVELAEKFAVEHHLSDEKKDRLLDAIHIHLEQALKKKEDNN